MDAKQCISEGRAILGIEFGSTRIKAVLIDEENRPIATGDHGWENRLENGYWTYHEEDIWSGLQDCYRRLAEDVKQKYQIRIRHLAGLGFSAMMHGYLVFDREGQLLTPFRTWRNTTTQQASEVLTEEFQFSIPLRWSVAHLYQAILNQEPHVRKIAFQTTLAGYLHWKMSGRKVLGIGEASGMFPVDSQTGQFRADLLNRFDGLAGCKEYQGGIPWKLREILPQVLAAGEDAGTLTAEGAALLDTSGDLEPGARLCPPEGDAGTGMTATNSVAVRTGNVSAGTSVFAMVVLEKELKQMHRELDVVMTPAGAPVAMVHCNNCTSELNAWAGLFREFAQAAGAELTTGQLYTLLFNSAQAGQPDCHGLFGCNYLSGEHITGLNAGRPLFARTPDSSLHLGDFMRLQLYSSLATLKIGLDILFREEKVELDRVCGHGGFFKTPLVGQKILAAAMHTPVTVMDHAGEGGAWGIALLAAYRLHRNEGESLGQFLDQRVFAQVTSHTEQPDPEEEKGFEAFMETYRDGLAIERAAVEHLSDGTK